MAANHPRDVNDFVFNHDPYVQHNITFQNDLNNRQVQISVNINNTINFNVPDPQRARQHIRNPQRIETDMLLDESSSDDDDDDDDSEDHDSDGTDGTTTTSSSDDDDGGNKKSYDANVPTPPLTDDQPNDTSAAHD